MDRERLKGNRDLLLSVLSSGPAHGYAIISALRDCGGGTFGWAVQGVLRSAAGRAQAEPGWSA